MEIEKKLEEIGKILFYNYKKGNIDSFILISSSYKDSRVSFNINGTKYSVMALLNRIIAELSDHWGMSTSDILNILTEGQKEYDEWLERLKGVNKNE